MSTNCYIEENKHNTNLLNEYFEALSSNLTKPQIWVEIFGIDEISRSKSVLYLLSFLLLCVYGYTYEEALEKVDIEWLNKHKITELGMGKYLKVRSTDGFISIFRYRNLLLKIIYENWDIETDLLKIYEYQAKFEEINNGRHSLLYNEYFKIIKLLENK